MTTTLNRRLLGPVMFWTVLTTIFTWLPLIRIIGRPAGYNWSILGIGGEGYQGPFWIFIPLAILAVVLLYTGERGPRNVFQPLVILWNLVVLGVVVVALVQSENAQWQGQGLYWQIPMWIVVVPASMFTILTIIWVFVDRRYPAIPAAPWTRKNSLRLAASLVLLLAALVLFRAGTNYNQVTALAIISTISFWLVLAWSFERIIR